MNGSETLRERLARAEKMMQIGAAEISASIAGAVFIQRFKIFGEFSFRYLQCFIKIFVLWKLEIRNWKFLFIYSSVSCLARRYHAVKHINAG